jgi:hypothetical protein
MMDLESFNNYITFEYVCGCILEEKILNEDSIFYINSARKFLKKTTKSLDSILNIKLNIREDEDFYIQSPLKDIIDIYGKDASKISADDFIELKEMFSSIINKLDNLKENPKKFYNTEDADITFDFLMELLPCFTQVYVN